MGTIPYRTQKELAEALLRGEQKAWALFTRQGTPDDEILYRPLFKAAKRVSSRNDERAESVLQEFVADKLWPNRQAFFGGAAKDRMLIAYLRTSLTNHINDLFRKRDRESRERPFPEAKGDDEDPPEHNLAVAKRTESPDDEDGWDSRIRAKEREWQEARMAIDRCPGLRRGRAPYYACLLLGERLLAYRRCRAKLEADSVEEGVDKDFLHDPLPSMIERTMPWSPEVANLRFTDSGPTLADSWESLRTEMERLEPVDFNRVAEILKVDRERWDQWSRRARNIVIDSVGDPDLAREYFPHWPVAQRRPKAKS